MKKFLWRSLLVVLAGVFCFSAYQVFSYLQEKHRSEQITGEAAQFVEAIPDESGEETSSEPERITVDFDALRQVNPDIVAWLYGADTGLNYPIVQGEDNDYYLHRLLDGTTNLNGTLFMDYECAPDFSGQNTMVYGHNMRSGNMFGHLVNYQDPAYYEAHPYLYLMTPEQTYRLDLLAGFVTDADAPVYSLELSEEYLASCMANSAFSARTEEPVGRHLITLSTCSYEYDNARFVVLAEMVPVD